MEKNRTSFGKASNNLLEGVAQNRYCSLGRGANVTQLVGYCGWKRDTGQVHIINKQYRKGNREHSSKFNKKDGQVLLKKMIKGYVDDERGQHHHKTSSCIFVRDSQTRSVSVADVCLGLSYNQGALGLVKMKEQDQDRKIACPLLKFLILKIFYSLY